MHETINSLKQKSYRYIFEKSPFLFGCCRDKYITELATEDTKLQA